MDTAILAKYAFRGSEIPTALINAMENLGDRDVVELKCGENMPITAGLVPKFGYSAWLIEEFCWTGEEWISIGYL